ncbi:MAG: PQQ-dependent sugar dehydrogenase [Burkholderiales bacterium]
MSARLAYRTRAARAAGWCIACAVALLLAGCWISISSGDGSESTSIVLRISGLPVGADAAVSISGPSGTFVARGSVTYSGLAAGTYTVTASEVLTGSAVARPTPVTQSITLRDNETKTVAVSYALAGAFSVRYQDLIAASGGVTEPIFLAAPPGDARLFIAERAGRIRIVQNGILLAAPFLDLSARVSTAGEGGLLSFAFHPQFAVNRWFYVHFTDAAGDIVVERYTASIVDPNLSGTVPTSIIAIPHPTFSNHNGGRVTFGPDGMFYLSTGDGGGAGDPNRNAQNLGSLLGKILRLDMAVTPYAIPASNPFVGQVGRRAEIWAYGLRNPWRFAFDPPGTSLFIADVGQGQREEINAVPASASGLNFGWPVTEGTICFPASAACDGAGLQPPVHDYDHGQGCSITGGYVYRGAAIPELTGRYFYSDFCGGWLRSFRPISGTATERVDWNLPAFGAVVSFGEDASGELYVLASNGRVARIVRN